jgi:hypothetical protein
VISLSVGLGGFATASRNASRSTPVSTVRRRSSITRLAPGQARSPAVNPLIAMVRFIGPFAEAVTRNSMRLFLSSRDTGLREGEGIDDPFSKNVRKTPCASI